MKKLMKNTLWGIPVSMLYLGLAKAQAFGSGNFSQNFKNIYNWIVGLAGLIFVVMFLIGGIQYLTSAGNEEASTKAKKLLIDAVIGIVVVAIAYVAGSWVLTQLGITGGGSIPVPVQ
ncbi:MAG: pilin [Patescibacteria group bacterium]|nr:pilin [Patescibacteria group bacterium]